MPQEPQRWNEDGPLELSGVDIVHGHTRTQVRQYITGVKGNRFLELALRYADRMSR